MFISGQVRNIKAFGPSEHILAKISRSIEVNRGLRKYVAEKNIKFYFECFQVSRNDSNNFPLTYGSP